MTLKLKQYLNTSNVILQYDFWKTTPKNYLFKYI